MINPVHSMKLQTDCASYFRSNQYRQLLRNSDVTVKLQQSPPYTQARNGIAERFIGSIMTTANACRYAANLPPEHWWWSVRHAQMLYDTRPRTKACGREGLSPFEMRTGQQPDNTHLNAFGTPAHAKIMTARGKLEPKSREGIYVGYSDENESDLIYFPATTTSRHVLIETTHAKLDTKRVPRDALTGGPVPIFHPSEYDEPTPDADIITSETPVEYSNAKHDRMADEQQDPQPQQPLQAPDGFWIPQDTGSITVGPGDNPEPTLIAGWKRAVTEQGRSYYWNTQTRAVTWDAPLAQPQPDLTPPTTTLPENQTPQHEEADPKLPTEPEPQKEQVLRSRLLSKLVTQTPTQPQGDATLPSTAKGATPDTPQKKRKQQAPVAPARRSQRSRSSLRSINARRMAYASLLQMNTMASELAYTEHDPGMDRVTIEQYKGSVSAYATIGEPIKGWKKASKEAEHEEFFQAYKQEMAKLIKLGAIKRVLRKHVPHGTRIFRSQTIFLLKPNGQGGIEKVKARTVLDGSQMQEGTHYGDCVYLAHAALGNHPSINCNLRRARSHTLHIRCTVGLPTLRRRGTNATHELSSRTRRVG